MQLQQTLSFVKLGGKVFVFMLKLQNFRLEFLFVLVVKILLVGVSLEEFVVLPNRKTFGSVVEVTNCLGELILVQLEQVVVEIVVGNRSVDLAELGLGLFVLALDKLTLALQRLQFGLQFLHFTLLLHFFLFNSAFGLTKLVKSSLKGNSSVSH